MRLRQPTRPEEWLAIGLLLAVYALAGVNSLVRDSATFDETAHLAAGLSYLDRLDFRLNNEHPPAAKAWAALPLWLTGRGEADYESRAWREGNQWVFGYELLNGPVGQAERRDPARLLVPARCGMLLLGMALGLVVHGWSRRLWGPWGGLLSLFLYVLSPTMLAHGRLVTTDLPAALGFVLAVRGFGALLERPGAARLAGFAGAVALAMLTKFSALVLGPVVVTLAAARVLIRRNEARRVLGWTAAAGVAAVLLSWVALWAAYGFRFRAAAVPGFTPDWSIVGLTDGPARQMIDLALERQLLPEGYLYGMAYFLGGAGRRLAYLNGELSVVGRWQYFPEAFLLKTPLSLLLLAPVLALSSDWRRGWGSFRSWWLGLPAAVYLVPSLLSNLNIGHRHLVPLYPLLFVALGALAGLSRRRGRGTATLLVVLLALHVVSFARATPGYLSYFNLLAGGPKGGARYLLDSNLDWGQDLARLGRWVRQTGHPEIHLAYFGTADPSAYGIRYRKIRMVHDFRPGVPEQRPRSGELVAASVNLLHGLYLDEDREAAQALLRRAWITPTQLDLWLAHRERLSRDGVDPPGLGEWSIEQGWIRPDQWATVRQGLSTTWFEKLRDQRPVTWIGDSIRVYRAP